jgi:hypothetical protein
MGRPPKLVKRDHQLNLKITREEFEAVCLRAQDFGLPLVDYGRWVLLERGNPKVLPVPPEPLFDRLVYSQLQRLGNLLNQLVRHAHQTGRVPAEELLGLLRDIRALLARHLS